MILKISILFLLIIFIVSRLFILSKMQKNKICKNCLSADTERIARGAWIKKFLKLDHLQKLWCRKCGRIFYVRNSD
jgi:ribosomal protein L37AE/L43A